MWMRPKDKEPPFDEDVLFLIYRNGMLHRCFGYRQDESNWIDYQQVDSDGDFSPAAHHEVHYWMKYPEIPKYT